ncbi:MAG: glycerol-3-phosphate 1-O-acyltransferase PlsY [Pseudomonadota bacterium]
MPDPISWTHSAPFFLVALAFGYLLGSIPFGLLLTKIAGLGDIRAIGSGNIGTTNVLRTGRKDLAALTLIGDALKGAVAYLVAAQWGPDTAVIAGFGAFIGHLFPVWLRFKGGKGVATFLGILLAASWIIGLGFAIMWIAVAVMFRFSSLSALSASLLTPIGLATLSEWQLAELFAVLAALLWFMHRENIQRLSKGTESKIGQKPAPTANPASDSSSGGDQKNGG